MVSDDKIEIFRQMRTVHDKYTYFLMAVDGAIVAYAIKLTEESTISWSMIPLGFAIVLWGYSFYCGCMYLRNVSSGLFFNFELLRVQEGKHPITGNNPLKITEFSKWIRESLEKNSNEGADYLQKQFRSLISGSFLFVVWHIIEMIERTWGFCW